MILKTLRAVIAVAPHCPSFRSGLVAAPLTIPQRNWPKVSQRPTGTEAD